MFETHEFKSKNKIYRLNLISFKVASRYIQTINIDHLFLSNHRSTFYIANTTNGLANLEPYAKHWMFFLKLDLDILFSTPYFSANLTRLILTNCWQILVYNTAPIIITFITRWSIMSNVWILWGAVRGLLKSHERMPAPQSSLIFLTIPCW